jgi:hypothetical protein
LGERGRERERGEQQEERGTRKETRERRTGRAGRERGGEQGEKKTYVQNTIDIVNREGSHVCVSTERC